VNRLEFLRINDSEAPDGMALVRGENYGPVSHVSALLKRKKPGRANVPVSIFATIPQEEAPESVRNPTTSIFLR
jgi:hypothetical protein